MCWQTRSSSEKQHILDVFMPKTAQGGRKSKYVLQIYIVNRYIQSKSFRSMKKDYISPEMEILDLVSEGVICGSNELLEENEGEW